MEFIMKYGEALMNNEGKTKKKYLNIESQDLKTDYYPFDTSENIENSINKIVDEFYTIAMQNEERIDSEINK